MDNAVEFKVGVFFGKMIPPHLGHVNQIIEAAARCEKLYVIVSENEHQTKNLSESASVKPIHGALRVQWLSQVFQDVDHIQVKLINETNIPVYPNGWQAWSDLLAAAVGEQIDAFFCGEHEYVEPLHQYFRNCTVSVFNPDRTEVNISATEVRGNVWDNWQYLIGPARPHFAKKVLIVGTASCGKTTLTKSLAKLYNTSWSEEVGRYYAQKYLGGSEEYFVDEDFRRIAHLQYEQDYEALRSANKICFFDTDATITQYYSLMYMGHENEHVEQYVDPEKYDLVLMLTPQVPFVDDGQRLPEADRNTNFEVLMKMYEERGFGDKIVVVDGANYLTRLHQAKAAIKELIEGE